jgi:hypothetical protein
MFERFTNRARDVVKLAQQEARRLDHDHIGTEHVLLGLLGEPQSIGAKALVALGLSLEAVRTDVERIIGRGKQAPTGHIPFTPRAKKVLEMSLREALKLHHNYIGTEHIVLGLVREGEGVAAKILVASGANLPEVRQEVLRLLASGVADRAGAEPPKERLIADIEALYEEIVRLARRSTASPSCCASTASSRTRAPRARPDLPPQLLGSAPLPMSPSGHGRHEDRPLAVVGAADQDPFPGRAVLPGRPRADQRRASQAGRAGQHRGHGPGSARGPGADRRGDPAARQPRRRRAGRCMPDRPQSPTAAPRSPRGIPYPQPGCGPPHQA